jgi:hypothetical protein
MMRLLQKLIVLEDLLVGIGNEHEISEDLNTRYLDLHACQEAAHGGLVCGFPMAIRN